MANNVATLYHRLPGVGCVFKIMGNRVITFYMHTQCPFYSLQSALASNSRLTLFSSLFLLLIGLICLFRDGGGYVALACPQLSPQLLKSSNPPTSPPKYLCNRCVPSCLNSNWAIFINMFVFIMLIFYLVLPARTNICKLTFVRNVIFKFKSIQRKS